MKNLNCKLKMSKGQCKQAWDLKTPVSVSLGRATLSGVYLHENLLSFHSADQKKSLSVFDRRSGEVALLKYAQNILFF